MPISGRGEDAPPVDRLLRRGHSYGSGAGWGARGCAQVSRGRERSKRGRVGVPRRKEKASRLDDEVVVGDEDRLLRERDVVAALDKRRALNLRGW
jgi:hypothetical protein